MAKQTELIKSAEAKISQLKQVLNKLNSSRTKVEAEIKAYENLIEWTKTVKPKGKKSNDLERNKK